MTSNSRIPVYIIINLLGISTILLGFTECTSATPAVPSQDDSATGYLEEVHKELVHSIFDAVSAVVQMNVRVMVVQ